MYQALVKHSGRSRPLIATRVVKYGMPDRVHTATVSGMGAEEFFGPPKIGQTFADYQSFMSTPIAIGIGSGMAVAIAINPLIGLLVGGVALLGARAKQKSKTSGGY